MKLIKRIDDKYKKVFWALISPLLAGFTVYTVLKQSKNVSVDDLINSAVGADKAWFGSALLSTALYIIFEAAALCCISKGIGHKRSLRQGFFYSTSDIYFSAITPSATGGQPASAYFMLRDGIPAGAVTVTLILNLMLYTMAIVVLGIVSMIIYPSALVGFSTVSKVFILLGFTVFTGLSIFFLLILKSGNWIFSLASSFLRFLNRKGIVHQLAPKLLKLDKAHTDYAQCAHAIAGRTSIMIRAFLWNLLQRSSQIIVPMLLYISMGGKTIHAAEIFSKQCLITIGYNFVPVPGAMGISDYLMIDGFTDLMGREFAFQLEMLSRGMTFYICVTLSGIFTLIGYLIGRFRSQNSLTKKSKKKSNI